MLKVVNLDVCLLDSSVHPVYYIYYKIPDIFYRSRILYIWSLYKTFIHLIKVDNRIVINTVIVTAGNFEP
jgi:hypothetical protein